MWKLKLFSHLLLWKESIKFKLKPGRSQKMWKINYSTLIIVCSTLNTSIVIFSHSLAIMMERIMFGLVWDSKPLLQVYVLMPPRSQYEKVKYKEFKASVTKVRTSFVLFSLNDSKGCVFTYMYVSHAGQDYPPSDIQRWSRAVSNWASWNLQVFIGLSAWRSSNCDQRLDEFYQMSMLQYKFNII